MLLLHQRLCQWVSDVTVNWYSSYLHISCINDLMDEMEEPKYMFGSLVRFRFLSLCNGSIVITIKIYLDCNAKNNTQFNNELLDPITAFLAASNIAIYVTLQQNQPLFLTLNSSSLQHCHSGKIHNLTAIQSCLCQTRNWQQCNILLPIPFHLHILRMYLQSF